MIQCSKCNSGEPHLHQPSAVGCQGCADLQAEVQRLNLQVDGLKKQLRTAQEVISKHATDGIEGLHCVDCVAEDDEMCDCPMLVPFWEAMKGYTEKTKCEHKRVRLYDGVCLDCGAHTEKRKRDETNMEGSPGAL